MSYSAITCGTNKFSTMAIESAKRFEDVNGIPVRVLNEDDVNTLPLNHIWFVKCFVWKFVTTDYVIWFDADLRANKRMVLPIGNSFFATEDYNGKFIRRIKKKHGLDVYVNAGFFVAHRSTIPIFEDWSIENDSYVPGKYDFADQCALNIILHHKYHKLLELLPSTYNWLIKKLGQNDDCFNIHYAGCHSWIK